MPKDLHIGVIVPLHKKGDKLDCKNYRGITLLSTVYKILVGIIAQNIKQYAIKIIGEYQAGFMPGKSTIYQIFILRQILEKCHEFQVPNFHLFVDYSQAYDSIDRTFLWNAMRELGVPMKLIKLAKMTVEGSSNRIKIQGEMSAEFETKTGVRQGDCLAPLLFNLVVEKVMRNANLLHKATIWRKSTQQLVYADDKDLIGRSLLAVKEQFIKLQSATQECGLTINENKTKMMCISKDRFGQNITMDNYNFENVESFKYLGFIVTKDNNCSIDIAERIKAANKCYFSIQKLIKSNLLTRTSKIRLYKTIIRPTLLYACETWTLKKTDENKLNIFERKILRRIFGPVEENGIWRLRTNQECMDMYKDCCITTWIKIQRLRWFGHINRTDPNDIISKIYHGKPEGKRQVGRPKARWRDNVLGDLKALDIRNWTELVKDRTQWRRILKEAKTLNGL